MKWRLAVLVLLMIGATSPERASAQQRLEEEAAAGRAALLIANAGYPEADPKLVHLNKGARALADEWRRNGFAVTFKTANTASVRTASDHTASAKMASFTTASTASDAQLSEMPGETFRDCPDCPEMVVIPPGEFDMGTNDSPMEKPVHRVIIARPIAIGRKEITFAEWDQCFAAGVCKHRPDDRGWGRGDRPVIDVSWDDAQLFLSWLSQRTGKKYRLPTEAEWEYAARAGTTTAFWWGRDVGAGLANCEGCGSPAGGRTSPTGAFRPNAFGLYDTSGNAAEWVEDCWNDSYRNAPKDGSAWTTGQCQLRVLRGGSFGGKASAARSGARFRYDRDVRYFANGFRAARDL